LVVDLSHFVKKWCKGRGKIGKKIKIGKIEEIEKNNLFNLSN